MCEDERRGCKAPGQMLERACRVHSRAQRRQGAAGPGAGAPVQDAVLVQVRHRGGHLRTQRETAAAGRPSAQTDGPPHSPALGTERRPPALPRPAIARAAGHRACTKMAAACCSLYCRPSSCRRSMTWPPLQGRAGTAEGRRRPGWTAHSRVSCRRSMRAAASILARSAHRSQPRTRTSRKRRQRAQRDPSPVGTVGQGERAHRSHSRTRTSWRGERSTSRHSTMWGWSSSASRSDSLRACKAAGGACGRSGRAITMLGWSSRAGRSDSLNSRREEQGGQRLCERARVCGRDVGQPPAGPAAAAAGVRE